MNWKFLGLVFVAGLFLLLPKQVSFVSADTLNQTDASVTVSGVVDVTLNGTTIAFGNVAPGSANSSATTGFPVEITIHSNTNTVTTIKVNGTNFGGAGTLEVRNVTYTNGSVTAYKTELNLTFTSGSDNAGQPFDDWISIADPAVDATRNVLWWISIPALQAKGAYAGNVYIQVVDAS